MQSTLFKSYLNSGQELATPAPPSHLLNGLNTGEALTQLAGEWLIVMPEKTLFWPRTQTLFAADVHVGKGAAFRAQGVALPTGSSADSLTRLSLCLAKTRAERLVLLGDFLHNKHSINAAINAQLIAWRAQHDALSITLIRGNHDLKSGDPPASWRIDCVAEGEVCAPFVFNHHPTLSPAGYAFAGHVHPAVRLTGRGGESARLPCFWFGQDVGMLPSFGAFTGSHVIKPKRGDQVFAIAGAEVVAMHEKA